MVNLPDPGYTPANLRTLLKHAGLTQQAAADMIGVDGRTVRKWVADIGNASHRDMPLHQWLKLLDALQQCD